MEPRALVRTSSTAGPALTRRDVVRPLFRYWKAGLVTFLVVALGALASAWAWPRQYRAEMKILVKHDRVEPMLGADTESRLQSSEVSDHEINSEVALLQSRDLLERVAGASGLVKSGGPTDERRRVDLAVNTLRRSLAVAPMRRTALIHITFTSKDPEQAARVLSNLSKFYLEKHLEVHRAPGAQSFFTQQAEALRRELEAAEAKLVEYGKANNVVSVTAEREATLQRLAEFEAREQDLRAQVADATRRMTSLQTELTTTPERQPTLQRQQDNGELVRELTARTLDLEIKRTEMLRKFTPNYPPVVELEQQLAQARQALEAARKTPIRDEATDQNPTHQWLRNEVARVQTEREALLARVTATTRTIKDYEAKARRLDEQGPEQENLIRAVTTARENYLLYRRKAEEARISDALDDRRIANVAVAEPPRVPSIPISRRSLTLLAGLVLAVFAGLVVTFLLEFLNPRFRSRAEVERTLELPVLAVIPAPTARR